MPDRSVNNRRLARNTLMLYGRMLFNLVLSLFTSRMILAALGESDYGIYNVVGGVVAMFSVVTSSISGAISRFQTFELGKGDSGRLRDVFTVSMWIQICFGLVAFFLIESVGVWFLNTHMTIPAERMRAANWVLQFSAITFVSSITVTPYSASVVSHEDMGVFAWISIYETVFKFIVAILLYYIVEQIDKLFLYGLLLAASTLSVQFVYRIFCRKHYGECRMRMKFDKSIAKDIFSFAGWNFVGNGASLLVTQGISIVLNMIYGPVVNAARGLASTVNNIISGFANNFSMALGPQITKSYASGDKQYTIFLIERGARFAFYIFYIVALPVLFETKFLLNLWLVDVPQYTTNFVRLIIIVTLIDLFSTTLGYAQTATGKIKYYELGMSAIQVIYFLCCFFCLRGATRPPEYVYYFLAICNIVKIIMRLFFVKNSIGISIRKYFTSVFLRMILVVASSIVFPILAVQFLHDDGWCRFILITFTSVFCAAFSSFIIGCNKSEKAFVLSCLSSFIKKLSFR